MDIFNRKKVAELEAKLLKAEKQRDALASKLIDTEKNLSNAEKRLAALQETRNTIPDDCIPGSYCGACEFSKKYTIKCYPRGVRTGYICNKGTSCKSFVQKEDL